MTLYHTNILDEFEYEHSRAKVKVTVAIFRTKNHCHRSSALIYYPILTLLYTSIGYDNTSNKFALQLRMPRS